MPAAPSARKAPQRGSIAISTEDRLILRELAQQVAAVAALPIQAERIRLWQALNRCQPERPMVLAQTGGLMSESLLRCTDPLGRQWESALRWKLFCHEFIHDDYPCTATLDVRHAIEVSDYGLKEGRIYGDVDGYGAYRIDPPIVELADFDRIHPRRVTVDHEGTERRFQAANEVLGDLLQVRKVGETLCRNMLTRKLIHLRGFEQFLLDLYDHPEFVHRMMAFLRDDTLQEWELYEREGVLSYNAGPENIRGSGGVACTDRLPTADPSRPAQMQDMVCFGESQESIGVSPGLFDEFVLQYQLPLMNRFGLVDYGCCEPQDGKFDLLFNQIPRLNSVSVHPWGKRELAAEKLADRYIYAYKPHPGVIELPDPDFATAERELRETLAIARGCPVSLTMKTVLNPETADRITLWTDLAQRVVAEMA
ncbi:MAG: hypothetical protein HYW07_18020 [Candidatus Latescibacteria bacterium]|nr:hypothetical protein [Candidatus Latescibacterota bacterium]